MSKRFDSIRQQFRKAREIIIPRHTKDVPAQVNNNPHPDVVQSPASWSSNSTTNSGVGGPVTPELANASANRTEQDQNFQSVEQLLSNAHISLEMPRNPLLSSPTQTTSHILQGAHHLVLNQPVMISYAVSAENESIAMTMLAKRALAGAALDASARYPPPRCHPQTRQELRNWIVSWVTNTNRDSNLLWLYGSAGVGKTSVAQTIAEYCKDQGWLGAAFFFSRPNARDDPDRIIPSLVYQLAVAHPVFKSLITFLLTRDPLALDKTFQNQFNQLLVGPLSSMWENNGPSITQPLLIVLDGLDECRGDFPQQQLINLIASFATTCKEHGLPFVWIITSRPEWQIVSTFSTVKEYQSRELPVDDSSAQEDVRIYLRDGFCDIRKKYRDAFARGTQWPTDDQLLVISSTASGYFIFAATLLRFIGDDEIGNPVAQLDACLDFLKGNMVPKGSQNPLDPLDALYRGIIHTIHESNLPTALLILSFSVMTSWRFSSQTIANFLLLDQATFFASLRRLRSVLKIPLAEEADRVELGFYHASFGDYLREAYRLGEFGITRDVVVQRLHACSARWFCIWEREIDQTGSDVALDLMPWPSQRSYDEIVVVLKTRLWDLWCNADDATMSKLNESLHDINFSTFRYFIVPMMTTEITRLLRRFNDWSGKHSCSTPYVLRSESEYATDVTLTQKFSSVINRPGVTKADFRWLTSDDSEDWHYLFIPNTEHCIVTSPKEFNVLSTVLWNPGSMYFFLGHDSKTSLVFAYRPKIKMEAYVIGTFNVIRNTYTNAAGHAWPSQGDRDMIVRNVASHAAKSHFARPSIAHVILSFIAGSGYFDPAERLDQIREMIVATRSDPGTSLDSRLFNQILSVVPEHERHTVHSMLALLTSICHTIQFSHPPGIAVDDISRLLAMDREIVERAIQTVYPLIYRCPCILQGWSLHDRVYPLLALYPYQRDSSTRYYPHLHLDAAARLSVSSQFVSWCNYFLGVNCRLKDPQKLALCGLEAISVGDDEDFENFEDLKMISLTCCWAAFDQVLNQASGRLVHQLRDFHFCHLRLEDHYQHAGSRKAFIRAINNLYASARQDVHSQSTDRVVRTTSTCETDNQLLAQLGARNMVYRRATFPIPSNVDPSDETTGIYSISLHCDSHFGEWDWHRSCLWNMFLLGFGHNTCLVAILANETRSLSSAVDTQRKSM